MTDSTAIHSTITKQPKPTSVSPLDQSGSNKDEFFSVAKGSSVTPQDLKAAGFEMNNFRFYPSSFEEVTKRLKGFWVTNESTVFKNVYRIEKLPY
ncbi:TPA: hypothetical protein ACRZ6V_005334 [Vibrio harveyi]